MNDLGHLGCVRPPKRVRRVRLVVGMIAAMLAAGCSNSESPQPNTVDGYLILQRPDGSRAEFAWDQYQTIADCTEGMAYSFSDDEDGNGLGENFWTDKAFQNGSADQEQGWDRNLIEGTRCQRKAGAKAPEIDEAKAVSEWSTGEIIFGSLCAILLVAMGWGILNDWKD